MHRRQKKPCGKKPNYHGVIKRRGRDASLEATERSRAQQASRRQAVFGRGWVWPVKTLLDLLPPFIRNLIAFSFFINLLYLTSAIFMLQVFDRVIPSQSAETLLVLLIGAGIALLLLLALDYVRSRLQGVLGGIVEERLSPSVVELSVAVAARSPGGARTDAVRDVASLRNLFSGPGVLALLDAPWLLIYLLVIFGFHPVLGIGATAFSVIMLAVAWLNDKTTRGPVENVQRGARRTQQFVDGSLRNAEILQALGMTRFLVARWRAMQDKLGHIQQPVARTTVAFTAATRFLRQLIQIVMLALGAYLVLSQQASPGIMIATTILVGRALQPVEQLVASWRGLIEGRAAYLRLNELFAKKESISAPMALPRPAGKVNVEAVSFRAPGSDRLILANIAFELLPGEALAILGPSAAGKSTLARLMCGIWRPAQGVVRLDGVDISQWSRDELGPWMGYAPQDIELFEGTVAENIARLQEVNSDSVITAARRANAHDLILGLPNGYDTQVGELGGLLSPGQRQRIGLARALYGDPRFVILDEPNSNLDGAGEMALAQALGGLRSEGVTSVVITHRPSLMAHVDKILVLEAGKTQQYGPAPEVMKWLQRNAQVAVAGRAA
jgi:PrtD family type I secretion system ABC transporter